nr:oxygenase MpaB family protein [Corynebacterium stercoris]
MAVVDTFKRDRKKARADFQTALTEGIDKVENPEPELVALFEQLDTLPEWFDLESAERGRVAYYNVIPVAEEIAIAFSFYGTIMEDRTSAATAETNMFEFQPLKRSLETTKMLASIGLQDVFNRFSVGFQSAVNVRLIHAQANRGLGKMWGESHYNRFGCPVPSSAVSTGIGWFALVPLAADELFGRKHSEQEWNDLAMYWAYMLYIMGVEDEIIPKNAEDMRRQVDYLFAGAGDGNQFRTRMADTLFQAMELADPEMPYKSMGAVSLLTGREAVTEALKDTRWDSPKIDEYAAAARERGEQQAREAIEADAQPDAEERRRARAQEGMPPWMTRHKGILAAIERAELPVKPDYTGHDQVHEVGAVVPKGI